MDNHTLLVASPLLACLAFLGDPPEWGGFRGNNGAGLGEANVLPDILDPQANLAWRVEVPPGYSSPTVAGERIFLTGVIEGQRLVTLCLDRTTGEERWRAELDYDGERIGASSAAAPSPTTDGELVFALFHPFGLIAYDLDGEERWRMPMDPPNIPHGLSSSPLIHEDLVILQVDQDLGAYLIALDRETGEQRWRVERKDVTHGYATPALYSPAEGPAQVVTSGSFEIAGYSVEDGEKLWWVRGAAYQAKCVPVIVGDRCYVNSFFLSASEMGLPSFNQTFAELLEQRDADGDGQIARAEWEHEYLQMAWFIFDLNDDGFLDEGDWDYALAADRATGGMFAIRLGGRGDVTDSHVLWVYDKRKGIPHIPSPVVVGDLLFNVKEGGILTAHDVETGEVVKTARVGRPDQYFASPVAAAGKLVTVSQSGQLAVIRAVAEWEVLGLTNLDEDVWSTPALAGEDVLVRSLEALYCFRGAAAPAAAKAEDEQG